jgi:predicted secreted protein
LTGLSSLVRAVAGSLPATIVAVIGFGLLAMGAGVLGFGLRATGAAALYFVVWWIGLFAVLPFGVRSQAEDEDVVVGSEPGAPSAPALREKAVWTSLLATVVFVAAVALLPLAGL